MADRASPCSAEKRRLRPASSDRIHHAPRMHCMLTATGQPHHSVSPGNCCFTAPAGRTTLVVCNKSAKLHHVPLRWPSSLSAPFFPLSTADPFFSRGRGNLAASRSRDSPLVRGGSSPSPVARDPLPDPRGRPRLTLVLPLPSTVPGDIDAVALDAAGAMLGYIWGGSKCPGAVASLFSAVREFPVAADKSPPGSVCSLTPGSPSDARVAPSGGVTPTAKGSLSRAGPVPSAGIVTIAEVALGCLRGGGQGSRHRGILSPDHEDVLGCYLISTSWLRLPRNPRGTFRRRGCSFR